MSLTINHSSDRKCSSWKLTTENEKWEKTIQEVIEEARLYGVRFTALKVQNLCQKWYK